MASTDMQSAPPKSEAPAPAPTATCRVNCFVGDVALRFLLFAATLVAVVVMVTSKQTVLVPVAALGLSVPIPAKFNHSPAFIYFVVALSVACLYSIITALATVFVILKPAFSKKFLLFFAIFDVVILGIVASATGTAGAVAYIGLKGNNHVRWNKVCDTYGKFCRHIGSSVAISLLASIILVILIKLSVYSLYKRIRD